jgi:hypothetical protein
MTIEKEEAKVIFSIMKKLKETAEIDFRKFSEKLQDSSYIRDLKIDNLLNNF